MHGREHRYPRVRTGGNSLLHEKLSLFSAVWRRGKPPHGRANTTARTVREEGRLAGPGTRETAATHPKARTPEEHAAGQRRGPALCAQGPPKKSKF
jgi:hypothetical protein